MATVKATYVTKYDAGGSGDNIVPDGFIKTVEKVWIDTYTFASSLASSSSILIARIPKNKKITDIVVHMPPCQITAGTATSIYCCTGATVSATTYFGKLVLGGDTQKTTFDGLTAATLRLNAVGVANFGEPLAADTGIYITVGPSITTAGTLRSIVRYT